MLFEVITAVYLLGGGVSLTLAAAISRSDDFVGQTELSLIIFSSGAWMSLAGIEILANAPSTMKAIAMTKMWIGGSGAFLWALFATRYADIRINSHISNRFFTIFFILFMVVGDFTTRYLAGYWNSSYPVATGEFSYVHAFAYITPAWLIIPLVANFAATFGTYWVFKETFAKQNNNGTRAILLLSIGLIVEIIISTLTIAGVTAPQGFDYLPLGTFVFTLCLAYVFMREQSQYMQPIERDNIYESLSAPTIVLDEKNRLVDYNPEAASIFPWVVDNHRTKLTNHSPFDTYSIEEIKTQELALKMDTSPQKYFEIDVTEVHEDDGVVGNTLLFQDKTSQRLLRQALNEDTTAALEPESIEDLLTEVHENNSEKVESLSIFQTKTVICNRIAFQEILRKIIEHSTPNTDDLVNISVWAADGYLSFEVNSTTSLGVDSTLELLSGLNGWEFKEPETTGTGQKFVFQDVEYED